MNFVYDESKKQIIITHEEKMLEKFSKIISKYSSLFKEYDYSLKVDFFWINELTNKVSNQRIPFCNGYTCYIFCEVQKDGKEVCVKSNDGEVDYYPLSTTWMVSSIKRNVFKIYVSLYSNIDEADKDMEELIRLLPNELI